MTSGDAPNEHSRGHADYHDPLAGIGGAPPAYSALTLRLALAIFGFIVCTGGAVIFGLIAAAPVALVVIFAVFAAVAAVDAAVIIRRKRRGEPG